MLWILRTGAWDLIGKYASPFLSLTRQRNMGITSGKIIMGHTKGGITLLQPPFREVAIPKPDISNLEENRTFLICFYIELKIQIEK
jgi:hypothetical protein